MKNVKNLQYFTAITFFFLSILFTVTNSAVSINFNLNSSKNVFSYLESFSSIINGDILSISYAQAYGTSEEVELELELEEEQQVDVEEEKEEDVEEEKEEEKEEIEKGDDDNEIINYPQNDFVTPFELENTNDDNNDVETGLSESSSSITDGGIEEITSKKILQQPFDNIAAIGHGIDAQASVMGTPESDTLPQPPGGDTPPPPGGDTPPPPGGDTPPPPGGDTPPECPPGGDPNDRIKFTPPPPPPPECPPGGDPNDPRNLYTILPEIHVLKAIS